MDAFVDVHVIRELTRHATEADVRDCQWGLVREWQVPASVVDAFHGRRPFRVQGERMQIGQLRGELSCCIANRSVEPEVAAGRCKGKSPSRERVFEHPPEILLRKGPGG